METDVLVIGSGIAGMSAASEAASTCRVMIASKGALGRDGASITAQADVAVDGASCHSLLGISQADASDSPEQLANDMMREGEWLADEELVRIHSESIPLEIKRLRDEGLRIQGLVHNPGHSSARGVWINAAELCCLLRRRLKGRPISTLPYSMAIDLLRADGAVAGALFWDIVRGEPFLVRAKGTVLCTGGAMHLYPYTTAPATLTGDGIALALRAGAELRDMEFPMFLPYTLLSPPILAGATFPHDIAMLTSAHALNRCGERFMRTWDPVRVEKATRDIGATAAGLEIISGRGSPNGGIWLSLTHLPANLIDSMADWLPQGLSLRRFSGLPLESLLPDLTRDALETIPACHFWNGGISIDKRCATTVPGLFAAGEGTGGINGANRISGNGIGEAIVWGVRSGRFAAEYAALSAASLAVPLAASLAVPRPDDACAVTDEFLSFLQRHTDGSGSSAYALRRDIRKAAWEGIGLIRNDPGLANFAGILDRMRAQSRDVDLRTGERVWNRELLTSMENRNLLDVANCVLLAASRRRESRGAHYRTDHQWTEKRWSASIRTVNGADRAELKGPPFACNPDERRRYGVKGVMGW